MSDRKKRNSLFREKNIQKIESPEVLDQYLKVTSPGVWLVLFSIIILLVGICIWGVFGNIDSKMDVAVVSDDNGVYCLVPQSAIKSTLNNPVVEIDGKKINLKPDTITPTTITEDTNVYVLLAGNLKIGDIVYPIDVDSNLEKDVYTGSIVTETLHPMSLILN